MDELLKPNKAGKGEKFTVGVDAGTLKLVGTDEGLVAGAPDDIALI